MNALRVITSILGILTGISGITHGCFEAIQGNHATNGFIINAVGKGNSWTIWNNGSEGAITLIPNFLAAGIVTTIVGVLLAFWSAIFIQTKRGASIFLLVATCLFLSGGGAAQALPHMLTLNQRPHL